MQSAPPRHGGRLGATLRSRFHSSRIGIKEGRAKLGVASIADAAAGLRHTIEHVYREICATMELFLKNKIKFGIAAAIVLLYIIVRIGNAPLSPDKPIGKMSEDELTSFLDVCNRHHFDNIAVRVDNLDYFHNCQVARDTLGMMQAKKMGNPLSNFQLPPGAP